MNIASQSSTTEQTGRGHDQDFFFFVAERINSSKDIATGLEIKEMIKVVVPAFDLSHTLVLEGHGHEQDRVISDGEQVSLEVDREHPPKHFFSKPPTNFGTR
jgi:hypothetical protein